MRKMTVFIWIITFFLLYSVGLSSAGDIFYFEDFSHVSLNALPLRWLGGEKMAVQEKQGKRFLTVIEKTNTQIITIPNIKYPTNYEIRLKGFYHLAERNSYGYIFFTGSAFCGISREYCGINNNDSGLKEDINGSNFTATFKKKGDLLSFQVNNNPAVTLSDAGFKPSDAFKLVINRPVIGEAHIYEIKMTDMGE